MMKTITLLYGERFKNFQEKRAAPRDVFNADGIKSSLKLVSSLAAYFALCVGVVAAQSPPLAKKLIGMFEPEPERLSDTVSNDAPPADSVFYDPEP